MIIQSLLGVVHQPTLLLYNQGDECIRTTGGWGWSRGAGGGSGNYVIKNEGDITIHVRNYWSACTYTTLPIDLTPYSKIYIEKTVYGHRETRNSIQLLTSTSTSSTGGYDIEPTSIIDYDEDQDMVLDVSSLSGSHYITIRSWAQDPEYVIETVITKIWAEE